jgi:hypothetical protein
MKISKIDSWNINFCIFKQPGHQAGIPDSTTYRTGTAATAGSQSVTVPVEINKNYSLGGKVGNMDYFSPARRAVVRTHK